MVGTQTDEGDANPPRLVDTVNIVPGCRYLTLSHRWGSGKVFKLLRANIESLKKALPVDQLSKTFRDAIDFTREIGGEYIWIDSLCIIQDSPSDWENESKKMGDIYLGAHLGIAATGTGDPSGGLFVQRDKKLVEHIPVHVGTHVCDEHRHVLHPGHYSLIWRHVWEHGVEAAPLNTRGWVVQERFLAPRILHFGARQIFWECSTLEASETFPNGLPDTVFSKKTKKATLWLDSKTGNAGEAGKPVLKQWAMAVEAYTGSDLTHDSDKMIAISGLARKSQRESAGSSYLAGLWRKELITQLSWSVSGYRHKPRPLKYRCPSWSPFCTESKTFLTLWEIDYPDVKMTTLASCIEACTIPKSGDIFGSIQDGYVKLLCPLAAVEAFEGDRQAFMCAPTEDGIPILSSAPLFIMLDIQEDMEWLHNRPTGLLSVRLREPPSDQALKRNWLFLASLQSRGRVAIDPPGSNGYLHGIVLRSTGIKNGEFQRIGKFSSSDDKIVGFIDKASQRQVLPQARCGDRQPDGRYLVKII